MLFVKQKGKKKKYASTKASPPDASSLSLHIQRVNYVTLASIQCLNPYYTSPPATNYGWENLNDCLVPIWSEGPPIPDIGGNVSVENPIPSNENGNELNDLGGTDGSDNDADNYEKPMKSDDDDESDYPESDEDCYGSDEEN